MPDPCAAVSTYSENGVEWTYHCALDAGHSTTTTATSVDGADVDVITPTEHDYTLDDGQTPPPTPTESV